MSLIDERVYIRQTDLISPAQLTMPIYIVGAGSIGSWTALSLLKLGCQNIIIADDDTVEIHNAGSQVYASFDEGKLKVEALREKLPSLVENSAHLTIVNRSVDPENIPQAAGIVIMAVDSITVREQFFTRLKNSSRWFIDGRMGGNIVEVFTAKLDRQEDIEAYQKTLFPASEASTIPCSARSVVYNCFIMAGMITNIVARIAKQKMVPTELTVDLENFQMYS